MEDIKPQLIKSEIVESIWEPHIAKEHENHEILTSAIFVENKPAILYYHNESELVPSQEEIIQSMHVQESIKDIESSEPPEQCEEDLLQDRVEKALQRATQNAEKRLAKHEKQRQAKEKRHANKATKQCDKQPLLDKVKKCQKNDKLTPEQRMKKLARNRIRQDLRMKKEKAEREQLMRERLEQITFQEADPTHQPEYIKYLYEFKQNKFGCKDENTEKKHQNETTPTIRKYKNRNK